MVWVEKERGDEEEKDILGIFNLLRLKKEEKKIEKICLWIEVVGRLRNSHAIFKHANRKFFAR
jgi:hypothetical protein